MIKIKVIEGEGGWVTTGNTTQHRSNYVYAVMLFGFILHAISISGLTQHEAKLLFGKHYKMPGE